MLLLFFLRLLFFLSVPLATYLLDFLVFSSFSLFNNNNGVRWLWIMGNIFLKVSATAIWFACSAALLLPQILTKEVWNEFVTWPLKGGAHSEYDVASRCEEPHLEAFLRSRSNSIGSLAHLWVSCYLLLNTVSDLQLPKTSHNNLILSHPVFSAIFCVCNTTHFLGAYFQYVSLSPFYHWVRTLYLVFNEDEIHVYHILAQFDWNVLLTTIHKCLFALSFVVALSVVS